MRLTDSHCHLQDRAFDDDRPEVLRRALDELAWVLVVGDNLESSREALALGGDRVRAAVGYHPYHARDALDSGLGALRELAVEPGVVAVGEIGLDYHHKVADEPAQREAFRRQLELAIEVGRSVVVHSRDAEADTQAILREHAPHLAGVDMHCFGGSAAFAECMVDLGFHVSFAGNLTFPKAEPLRDAARAVPVDRLLVETDSPYLAPQPVRGKRCEPAYVRYTAECLAKLKGVTPDELAQRTTANAEALFRLARD